MPARARVVAEETDMYGMRGERGGGERGLSENGVWRREGKTDTEGMRGEGWIREY